MTKAKAVVASYVGVVALASVIFLAAGRLQFGPGLLYLALAVLGTTLTHALARQDSTLAADRANQAQQGQEWDRRLLRGYFLLSIAMFAVSGLDAGRYGWSGEVPPLVTGVGVVAMVLGQLLFAVARRENAFFSSTVQIDRERGQTVCASGPYRWIRHPGYLGMLLSLLAFPLVLGSYWSLVPALPAAALLVVRTVLEDRFLAQNLPGYREYAARTRWRLLPGVF